MGVLTLTFLSLVILGSAGTYVIVTWFCPYSFNSPMLSSKVIFKLSSCNLCCVKSCTAFAPLCPAVIRHVWTCCDPTTRSWTHLLCQAVTFSPQTSRTYGKQCPLKAAKNINIEWTTILDGFSENSNPYLNIWSEPHDILLRMLLFQGWISSY